jgi:glycosyltransferase involved in cell wall biosynthesis
MEAAAMGLPSVLSDVPGCREVARDGIEALFVPPRETAALTRAIRRLAADAALRARLGAAARTRALAEVDERRIFATVTEEYRRPLSARGTMSSAPP